MSSVTEEALGHKESLEQLYKKLGDCQEFIEHRKKTSALELQRLEQKYMIMLKYQQIVAKWEERCAKLVKMLAKKSTFSFSERRVER